MRPDFLQDKTINVIIVGVFAILLVSAIFVYAIENKITTDATKQLREQTRLRSFRQGTRTMESSRETTSGQFEGSETQTGFVEGTSSTLGSPSSTNVPPSSQPPQKNA
ncbi:hypothetical protein HY484_00925 [Candidatus Woesearchaeota archaeon]|nr:hypothetical protein [Candidatus Woesearchaeota archaeon]